MSTSFQNTLSWFDNANKHRIKLNTELGFNGNTQDQSSNLLGTFTFNSLDDLASGVPASFTRTLTARQRSTGQFTGAVALGDSYRRTQDLQIQYSLRLDGSISRRRRRSTRTSRARLGGGTTGSRRQS